MPAKTRAAQDRLRPAGGELVTCAELPAREEVPGYPVRAEGRVGWARPPEACTQLERAAVSASSTDTGIALLKVPVSLSWPSPVKAPQPRGISREESAAGYRPPQYRPQPMRPPPPRAGESGRDT